MEKTKLSKIASDSFFDFEANFRKILRNFRGLHLQSIKDIIPTTIFSSFIVRVVPGGQFSKDLEIFRGLKVKTCFLKPNSLPHSAAGRQNQNLGSPIKNPGYVPVTMLQLE
jgi:hypothetical protein